MSTNVITFPRPPSRPVVARPTCFKLTAADKIGLCRWEAAGASPAVARIAIHEGSGLCEEEADVALLYAPGGVWARWGLARREHDILVWRCHDGQDVGRFGSVHAALQALSFCAPSETPSASLQRATACPPTRRLIG